MAERHTPGPWRVEGRRGPGYIISAGVNTEGDGPAEYVGVIDPMFHVAGEGSERHAADAALICAAPALLEALKEGAALQAAHYGDGTGLHLAMVKWAAKALAAISQAEGGE